MNSSAVVMDKGMEVLLKNLGVLETEHFISTLLRERFDYTAWRREHYADIDSDHVGFNRRAVEFDKNNPV